MKEQRINHLKKKERMTIFCVKATMEAVHISMKTAIMGCLRIIKITK
jgi:hypothetical protein